MEPERWKQIEKLYSMALEHDARGRAVFLDHACAGDEALRREVESLLACRGEAESFIEAPALEVAARLLADEQADSAQKRRIGPYKLGAKLGAGGMGEVYLARDTRLGRKVALKLLPAEFTSDTDRVLRFEQEARAASALNHPNIITIYEIGQVEGVHFIATEFIDGETLRQRMEHVQMSLPEALDIALQIVRALNAAHEAGIAHRDIKPENIMLRRDGYVKVLDFGLAKLTEHQPSIADTQEPTVVLVRTRPGTVLGTVAYMSPEQARGLEVDARSDIWSLGVVMYEMIAKRRPFAGDSAIEVMNAILKEEPPELGETKAKITPALERIVRRCLEKKPEMRFQSASDLGFALEVLSAPSGSRPESATATHAVPESGGKSRLSRLERLMWIAASVALALTALGFALAYFTRQPASDARVFETSILPPEKTSFGRIVVSPDGRWLAFTAATGGKVQLWVRALNAIEAKALAGTEGATCPFWSPDSRLVGFFAGSKLKKIDISGGLPTTLCDVGVGTGGTWNRDGLILFSSLGGAGLSSISDKGGVVTSVMRPDWKRQETDFTDPCFMPDGRHFLFNILSGQKEARGIYLASLNGEEKRRLLGGDSNAVYAPSGSGGGLLLFGHEGALLAQPFDPVARQFTGEQFPVTERVGTVFDGTAAGISRLIVSASDNGVLIFDPFPNRQRNQLIWVDRGGTQIRSPERADNVFSSPRLSVDDQRFVISRFDPQTGHNDIWLSDEAGGNATPFTFDPANDIFPVWSPDRSRIVWSSNREGPYNLYQKAASGAGQDVLLFKSDYYKFPTDWSRNGRFIIYRQIDPKTKYDVWVLPVNGTVGPISGVQQPFPFLQTAANEAAATLSPDGQWIAYSSDESGRYEVYVQSFPGGGSKRKVSTGGGIGPHWRDDGKELFYHAPDGKLMAVEVKVGASFAARTPVPLFEFRVGGNVITPYYCVTSDGQRFLLSTIVETQAAAPLTVVVNWMAEAKRY
jgi:eukaryotic-like serine/threonine-protein kinase